MFKNVRKLSTILVNVAFMACAVQAQAQTKDPVQPAVEFHVDISKRDWPTERFSVAVPAGQTTRTITLDAPDGSAGAATVFRVSDVVLKGSKLSVTISLEQDTSRQAYGRLVDLDLGPDSPFRDAPLYASGIAIPQPDGSKVYEGVEIRAKLVGQSFSTTN